MATDNIAYSPTHPSVGAVAWQPYGPYATMAYTDDGVSVAPLTGYPSVYPHVLNIPPRINAFADLAMAPMYQPDPRVMEWFMQLMTQALRNPPRVSGGTAQPAPQVDIPTVNLNLPEPTLQRTPMDAAVGDVTREPGEFKPHEPAGGGGGGGGASSGRTVSGNSIIGGPTNLLDLIAQHGVSAVEPTSPMDPINDAIRDMPWWFRLYHNLVR